MADDGGLPRELADRVGVVIRDLLDALVGKDLRVVSWPAATVCGSSGQPGASVV